MLAYSMWRLVSGASSLCFDQDVHYSFRRYVIAPPTVHQWKVRNKVKCIFQSGQNQKALDPIYIRIDHCPAVKGSTKKGIFLTRYKQSTEGIQEWNVSHTTMTSLVFLFIYFYILIHIWFYIIHTVLWMYLKPNTLFGNSQKRNNAFNRALNRHCWVCCGSWCYTVFGHAVVELQHQNVDSVKF